MFSMIQWTVIWWGLFIFFAIILVAVLAARLSGYRDPLIPPPPPSYKLNCLKTAKIRRKGYCEWCNNECVYNINENNLTLFSGNPNNPEIHNHTFA